MIWVLVITLIASAADGGIGIGNVVGVAEPYASKQSCDKAKDAFIDAHKASKKPDITLAIGCSAIKLPAVV